MKVFGGVLVFGRVAATDVAARLAHAQMHPSITYSNALRTNVLGWGQDNCSNSLKVRAERHDVVELLCQNTLAAKARFDEFK
ncbi:hypothetical protein GCM10011383_03010 [Hymenobacter cavernae]|uniref:Secreted protein n=1 Tax=Hymenobacter cavernae TaxID=2044852 RepID=A0ABQ1TIG6_9BACT|nr:hypothetical protein GCM10011383_03010 [Hymenobacter cavernae]